MEMFFPASHQNIRMTFKSQSLRSILSKGSGERKSFVLNWKRLSKFLTCFGSFFREIEGVGRKNGIFQGIFLRWRYLIACNFHFGFWRIEACHRYDWILVSCLHVLQINGVIPQGSSRRRNPVAHLLGHFCHSVSCWRPFHIHCEHDSILLFYQDGTHCLVVPPKNCWRWSILQSNCKAKDHSLYWNQENRVKNVYPCFFVNTPIVKCESLIT